MCICRRKQGGQIVEWNGADTGKPDIPVLKPVLDSFELAARGVQPQTEMSAAFSVANKALDDSIDIVCYSVVTRIE